MLNLLSILFGIVSLAIVIPSQIPLLGWGNWFALLPLTVGVVLGAMSSKNTGRNFCLVVGAIAVVRLMIGGGFI